MKSAVLGAVALLWPLVLSLIAGNLTFTLVVYGIAMILDVALFVMWLKRAFSYSRRASRGETFTLQTASAAAPTRGIPAKH